MTRNPDGWGRRPHKWRGRWRAYLTLGYKPDGRPNRRYVYGKTEGECAARLEEAKAEARAGIDASDRRMTVRQYLDEWLAQKADEVSDRTLAIYRGELAHVTPHLARKRLVDVKPIDVERMMRAINGKEVQFGKNPKVTLSARAANAARRVFGTAMSDAVRLGMIATNPVDRTRPIRDRQADVQVWTAEQVSTFLQTTAGQTHYHALFYTALTTGMRVGELVALEWRDVDDGQLHVRRTAGSDRVKTEAAERVLPIGVDTMQVLERHRAALRSEAIDTALVFPTARGGATNRHLVRNALGRWARQAGVPRIRPHDLRHTYASMMIAAGANPAELARLLGHTNAGFTLRRYVHFFERAQHRAAPTLDDLTGGSAFTDRAGVHSGVQTPEGDDPADQAN